MSYEGHHHSPIEAAVSLAKNLETIKDLDAQRGQYQYGPPPRLAEDMETAAEAVRDALEFFASETELRHR